MQVMIEPMVVAPSPRKEATPSSYASRSKKRPPGLGRSAVKIVRQSLRANGIGIIVVVTADENDQADGDQDTADEQCGRTFRVASPALEERGGVDGG